MWFLGSSQSTIGRPTGRHIPLDWKLNCGLAAVRVVGAFLATEMTSRARRKLKTPQLSSSSGLVLYQTLFVTPRNDRLLVRGNVACDVWLD